MKICTRLLPRLLFWLISLLTPGMAGALTVEITPEFDHQLLGDGVTYLEDSSGAETWAAIQAARGWETFRDRELNFGFSSSAYWLRFHITNTTQLERHLVLQQRFPLIDSMKFYITRQNQLVDSLSMGDATPANQRELLHSDFLVPLTLKPSESVTVLIRAESGSGLQFPLTLWDRDTYIEKDHTLSMVHGLFYGLLLALALYHLFISFSIREPSFFYYALFYLSLLATYLCLHGVVSAYFWPDFRYVSNRFINVAMSSSVLFATLFTVEFLQITQARPKLARVLRGLAYIAIAVILASAALPYTWVVKSMLALTGAAIVLLSTTLVLRLIDGYPPAKFIFLGGIFASVGFAISMLGNLGFIPVTPGTEAATYVGMILMSMANAFALAYRMNMDRQLRQDAQNQLIEAQRQTNENLDRLVRERTEELETTNSRLKEISNTDALTRLPNRRSFDETFETELMRAFREKLPLSVMLMDIDHFKMINDRYGHPFGDVCLVRAADFIRRSIRRPPDFAARYGGEEFVVLLPNTDSKGSLYIANVILDQFNTNTVEEDDLNVSITVSIGLISVTPSTGDSTSSLLKKADELLYQAKTNGRNRIETETAGEKA